MLTPRDIIKKHFGNSKNFISRRILGYGTVYPGEVVYELSLGNGMNHSPFYGVTIVSYNPITGETQSRHKLSTIFPNKKSVYDYIKRIKNLLEFAKRK